MTEAWRRRLGGHGGAESRTRCLQVTVPVGIPCLEFLVHAWDLMIATGSQADRVRAAGTGGGRQGHSPPATCNSAGAVPAAVGLCPQSSIVPPSLTGRQPTGQATCPPPNERMIMPKRSEGGKYRQSVDLQTTDQSAAKSLHIVVRLGLRRQPGPLGGGLIPWLR